MRNPNTNVRGGSFTAAEVENVWRRGRVVSNNDPDVFRQDSCGAWIKRDQYGLETKYGWEIDHVRPVAHQGSDELANLQPLQWQNNRHKSDNWPNWSCLIAS